MKLEGLKSGGGDDGKLISEKKDVPDEPIDVERRQKVKEAMIHAWSSYEKYAWGHDELQVMIILFLFWAILLTLCFVS